MGCSTSTTRDASVPPASSLALESRILTPQPLIFFFLRRNSVLGFGKHGRQTCVLSVRGRFYLGTEVVHLSHHLHIIDAPRRQLFLLLPRPLLQQGVLVL